MAVKASKQDAMRCLNRIYAALGPTRI